MTGLILVDALLAGDGTSFCNAFATSSCRRRCWAISRWPTSPDDAQPHAGGARAANTSSRRGPRGCRERRVIWRHAFGNIPVPLVTVVALAYAGLLEGAVLTETVFAWPGIGHYITSRCSPPT